MLVLELGAHVGLWYVRKWIVFVCRCLSRVVLAGCVWCRWVGSVMERGAVDVRGVVQAIAGASGEV
jgi:hypothetical protein